MTELYMFIGESGSGKTTLADWFELNYDIPQIVSRTSRPARHTKETGYIFTSKEQFYKDKEDGIVEEEAHVFDNIYWTLKSDFEYEGKKIIVVEPKGAQHIIDHVKVDKLVSVYLKTDIETRRSRLFNRNMGDISPSEKYAAAEARIIGDKRVFKICQSNYVIDNNDSLADAIELLKPIILG